MAPMGPANVSAVVQMLLYVVDGVLNRTNILCFFVGDLDVKFFFHMHHKLYRSSESLKVIDGRLGHNFPSILAQLLSNDVTNTLLDLEDAGEFSLKVTDSAARQANGAAPSRAKKLVQFIRRSVNRVAWWRLNHSFLSA